MNNSNPIIWSQEELMRKVQQLGWWYQNFGLDGVQTNPIEPRYPEVRWNLIEPYIPKDLTGKTVLDWGCNDGYFSIKMKQKIEWRYMGNSASKWLFNESFISRLRVSLDFFEFPI